MSRIGKKVIVIPQGVEMIIEGKKLTVKGPKGTLEKELHPHIEAKKDGSNFSIVVRDENDKKDRALWGLYGSLIKNMVLGVTSGFEKKLEMSGIGFKAEVKGANLILDVGYSHQVQFPIPAGIQITVEKNVSITIKGIDKDLVGSTAARIRAIKKPEPYKGKGIKYADEIIRRKAGKAATKAAA